jgi:N-formylglutamate deformylase
MKSVGNAMNEDDGAPRPDFVVSDLHGRCADARLRDWVVQALRASGCSVGVNDPYRGGELVRRHGWPAGGRHSLQIEIKRSLYMDEASCEHHAGFDRLVNDLARFARRLTTALKGELGASLRPRIPPHPERSENA